MTETERETEREREYHALLEHDSYSNRSMLRGMSYECSVCGVRSGHGDMYLPPWIYRRRIKLFWSVLICLQTYSAILMLL